jgi:hypothetical protein
MPPSALWSQIIEPNGLSALRAIALLIALNPVEPDLDSLLSQIQLHVTDLPGGLES